MDIEQIEKVGQIFTAFMNQEYHHLKKSYHEDRNIKSMMNLPNYCFTMFIVAIKSFEENKSITLEE